MRFARLFAAMTLLSSFTLAQVIPDLQLTPKQWHEDLAFYSREIPARHMNAFHYTPREKWEAAVRGFDATLDHSDSDQAFVGFMRLAALIGDGHTNIGFPQDWPGRIIFPLFIARFDNDYRVTRAAPELKKALGARIIRIGDTPIDEAVAKLTAITPQDELPALSSLLVEGMLNHSRILHGAGILPTHDVARYTLVDDAGQEFTIEAHPVRVDSLNADTLTSLSAERPLSAQQPNEKFYFVYLPDTHAVYCNVRAIRDLDAPSKSLIDYLKAHRQDVQKLVIDLRQNGGGDYFVGLKKLVHPVRDLPWLKQKGHLFVLIGPRTFSAAMSNATHFRAQTNAILVGLPIGEKPNSYAESRRMTLPNSHWEASYSVRFYKFVDDNAENIVRPDQEIRRTWDEFKRGFDSTLDWALKYDVSAKNP